MATATAEQPRWRYPYVPTEKQRFAHQLVADEMLYGGAAGGGKSEWMLGDFVNHCLLIPNFRTVIFRKTYPALVKSLIPRLAERIPRTVGTFNKTDSIWTFRNGSTLELGYMDTELDTTTKYQGPEYQRIGFDELTQFTEFQYNWMLGRLRASGEVLATMDRLGVRLAMRASANPGGRGHHWVKAKFVDPAPANVVHRPDPTPDDPVPLSRVYVPARLDDNPHMDAGYASRLSSDPVLRRALRDGDWDILQGVRFSAWRRNIHVIDPEQFPIPLGGGVPRGVGVDYGLEAPFSAHWGAKFGDGLIVIYRELYTPGLTPRQQAEAIRDAEHDDERGPNRDIPIALDPACWQRAADQPIKSALGKDVPPAGSIASYYRDVFGTAVVKAKHERLAGAALLDDKLAVRADKLPRILVYSTCTNLIRTLPALSRSKKNPEDVETTEEDHAYDSLRYLLMELEQGGSKRPEQPSGWKGQDLRPETGGLSSAGF